MLLADKTAVVYGAGRAVGGAVAHSFAREGARVFLAGRTLAKLDAVAMEISAAGGVAETAPVDALDEEALDRHADDVAKRAGGIDVAFNAVGVEDHQGTPLIEMSPEDVSLPVKTRVAINHGTARAVARHMVRQGSGVILMITRDAGRMAFL
jgi:3-oxoacyl-[acyl-carrier protein] reductase